MNTNQLQMNVTFNNWLYLCKSIIKQQISKTFAGSSSCNDCWSDTTSHLKVSPWGVKETMTGRSSIYLRDLSSCLMYPEKGVHPASLSVSWNKKPWVLFHPLKRYTLTAKITNRLWWGHVSSLYQQLCLGSLHPPVDVAHPSWSCRAAGMHQTENLTETVTILWTVYVRTHTRARALTHTHLLLQSPSGILSHALLFAHLPPAATAAGNGYKDVLGRSSPGYNYVSG